MMSNLYKDRLLLPYDISMRIEKENLNVEKDCTPFVWLLFIVACILCVFGFFVWNKGNVTSYRLFFILFSTWLNEKQQARADKYDTEFEFGVCAK